MINRSALDLPEIAGKIHLKVMIKLARVIPWWTCRIHEATSDAHKNQDTETTKGIPNCEERLRFLERTQISEDRANDTAQCTIT